jgi:trigger factor
MKTTTKNLSDTKVEVKVILDSADLKTAREKALVNLAKDVKLQGFRKGKAPASMIEKSLSPNDIASETIDVAVRTTMPAAFDQAKLAPIAIEKVNVTKYVPEESAEYTAQADILPDVKLGDYKKLKVKLEKTEASAADVQEIVDNIIDAYAEKKVAKKAAANGDEVIIDFVGKKDGVEFAGGSAKDHHLVLGSGQFIPGFEDGIVGHAAGDKFDLEVTFPKDYPEKTLAGQKAVFETLVKQVNEVVKPKEDDELAKKCGNFKNMDELRADIKKNLEAQNEHRVSEKYRDDLVNELVKVSKVSAPEILINDQLRFIKDDLNRNAATHGMTFEQYLERTGQTAEDWEKQAHELAEARVKASLVLQILAREEKIMASDEEVEAKISELKDVYQKSKEALANLKKPEVRQDIKNRMTIDKTLDFLVAANQPQATKTKAKAEKAEKKPAKKAAKK